VPIIISDRFKKCQESAIAIDATVIPLGVWDNEKTISRNLITP